MAGAVGRARLQNRPQLSTQLAHLHTCRTGTYSTYLACVTAHLLFTLHTASLKYLRSCELHQLLRQNILLCRSVISVRISLADCETEQYNHIYQRSPC